MHAYRERRATGYITATFLEWMPTEGERAHTAERMQRMLKSVRSLFGSKESSPADPRELFATEVEHVLRGVPNVTDVRRVPGAFAFDVQTSEGPRRVFLGNAFAESRELSPQARRDRILHFFGTVGDEEGNEPWESARKTLVPVLRSATFVMGLSLDEHDAAPLRRPYLPYVDVLVVIDRPTSMSFVTRHAVERWKIEEREVFETAASHWPLLAGAKVELYDDSHGPLWIVTANDDYESSRLLVPGWLASFRGKVEGNPVAIIPQRSNLMIGGDGRPEMISRLCDTAEREFEASTHRLSTAIYTVDETGAVVPYAPSTGDGLGINVQIAHEKLAIHEYGRQKEALDARNAARGVDVYVAEYRVRMLHEDAPPRSSSIWIQGIRSYLPRSESVILAVPGDGRGAEPKLTLQVPFEAVANRLTRVSGLHPPRFETTGPFPSDKELRLLEKRPHP